MDPGEIVEEQIVWQEGVIVSWLAGRILVQAHYQNLNVNCLRYRRVAGSSPDHTPVEPPPPAAPCCRPRWGGCRGGGRRECSRTPCSTGWWTAAEHAYCLSHKININFFLSHFWQYHCLQHTTVFILILKLFKHALEKSCSSATKTQKALKSHTFDLALVFSKV